MTIERGATWGTPGRLPVDGLVVRTDAEARAVVESCRRAGQRLPTLGLLGGDLCRTLGGPGSETRLHSDDAMTFPIDVGAALLDGRLHWFVSHLIARRSWWRGRLVAVMNAQWLGGVGSRTEVPSRRRPLRHQRRQTSAGGPTASPPPAAARYSRAAPRHRHHASGCVAGGPGPATRHLARRREGDAGLRGVGSRRTGRLESCRLARRHSTSLRP